MKARADRTAIAVAAVAGFIAIPGLGHAGSSTIASPSIYGGSQESAARCAFYNAGTKPVSISPMNGTAATSIEVGLYDESGTLLALAAQVCAGTVTSIGDVCALAPGAIFFVDGIITPGIDGRRAGCRSRGSPFVLRLKDGARHAPKGVEP